MQVGQRSRMVARPARGMSSGGGGGAAASLNKDVDHSTLNNPRLSAGACSWWQSTSPHPRASLNYHAPTATTRSQACAHACFPASRYAGQPVDKPALGLPGSWIGACRHAWAFVWWSAGLLARVPASLQAGVLARLQNCGSFCSHACSLACSRACVLVCLRACVLACFRARACMLTCLHACALVPSAV